MIYRESLVDNDVEVMLDWIWRHGSSGKGREKFRQSGWDLDFHHYLHYGLPPEEERPWPFLLDRRL